jgi:hypothetical protein
MTYKTKAALLVACMLALGVASMPQNASAGGVCSVTPPTQQTALIRPIQLGVSGGNIHSFIRKKVNNKIRGCFSGTLGSMVQDASNNQFILSNNHVLADQNTAKPGDPIVQPGLVDTSCLKSTSDTVATFSNAIRLKFGHGTNDVDAAIAAVQPGEVAPEILFIGQIAGSPATPTIGMNVQKMGRTTCLTTGAIQATNVNLTVNYSDVRKPKPAKFVNQIRVIGSGSTTQFSAAGDSGSLIVTQGICPQPVALLFAGSADGSTIGNPISKVLSELNVSMVGTCTPAALSEPAQADLDAQSLGLSTEVVESAKAIRDRHEVALMRMPGAVGTGIAAGDQAGQPTIEVYVKKITPEAEAAASQDVDGTPVKLVETGEFVAY